MAGKVATKTAKKSADQVPALDVTDASRRLSDSKLRAAAFTASTENTLNTQQSAQSNANPVVPSSAVGPDVAATTSVELPPWLHAPLSQLHARFKKGRLPHALLVHAAPGMGKRLLVEALVAVLLCENRGEEISEQAKQEASEEPGGEATASLACGDCNSCLQLASGNHTDYRLLIPPEDKQSIVVDDTRSFINWTLLTSNSKSGVKIGVVDSVDVMNRSAVNSLLKTLEEPAAGTIIICIANWPGSLPATITSRCQMVPVPKGTASEVEQWLSGAGVDNAAVALQRADGSVFQAFNSQAPGRQEQQARLQRSFCDIVSARAGIAVWVERLAKESPTDCLEAYLSYTADILRVSQGAEKYCRNPDLIDMWKSTAPLLSTEQWFALFDRLQALHRIDNSSIKIQPVLETIFAVIWQQRSKQVESHGA